MTETRDDPGFVEILEDREHAYASVMAAGTRIAVIIAVILVGMFIFLV